MATAPVVKITNAMARVDMGLISDLKSCHEVFDAASYKIGGKKIRKTTSGFRLIPGIDGMKPMHNPATTSSTGLGNRNLSAAARSAMSAVKTMMSVAKFCMINVYSL